VGRGRQQELSEAERQECAALVGSLYGPQMSYATIGADAGRLVGRAKAFTSEAVRQAGLGQGGREILDALRLLAGGRAVSTEATREVDAPSDPTAPGRWRRRAQVDGSFLAVSTRARGLAANDSERRQVDTALDLAHDALPKNYGGLSVGETQRAFARALAFVRGEAETPALDPTPPPALVAPPAPATTLSLKDALAAAKKPKKR
jgi:hypothetical protein